MPRRPTVKLIGFVPSLAEEPVNMSNEINSTLWHQAIRKEPFLRHVRVKIVRGGGKGLRKFTEHLGQPPSSDGLTRSLGKDNRRIFGKVKALSGVVSENKVRRKDPFESPKGRDHRSDGPGDFAPHRGFASFKPSHCAIESVTQV
jgi:hypothetical protein